MKKPRTWVLAILGVYVALHIAYTIYMFTQDTTYGMIWTVLSALDLLVYLWILALRSKASPGARTVAVLFVLLILVNQGSSLFLYLAGGDRDNGNADYAIVLGYKLDHDQATDTLYRRLDKAREYLNEDPTVLLVLCGGVTEGNTVSEASVMQQYLLDRGVPANQMVLEDRSTSTIENIQNAVPIVRNAGRLVVISSSYHLFRAKQICRMAGLSAKGVGASAPALLLPNQYLHEKLALIGMLLGR